MQFVVKTWVWWKITFAISKTKYGPYISFKDDYVKKKWASKYPFKCMIYWWGFQKQIDDELWSLGKYLPRERKTQTPNHFDPQVQVWVQSLKSKDLCVFANANGWMACKQHKMMNPGSRCLKKHIFLADYKRSQRLDGHELLSSVGWRCNTVFIL